MLKDEKFINKPSDRASNIDPGNLLGQGSDEIQPKYNLSQFFENQMAQQPPPRQPAGQPG